MRYSPKRFALMMFCFIGIGAIKLISGGYQLATLESEEQVEKRARELAASMFPRERPAVQEAAGYLATTGRMRIHDERFNRALENLTSGGYLLLLVMIVIGERRARLGRDGLEAKLLETPVKLLGDHAQA